MNNFWNDRYSNGGNSGSGSYGQKGICKANIINDYIIKYNVHTITDLGCGDGNVVSLLKGYDKYLGFDISEHVIGICKEKFKNMPNMSFTSNIEETIKADLSISIDVIYHIINEKDYEFYLNKLFEISEKYVLIFSSNHCNNNHNDSHIFHRNFTDWVEKNKKDFKLIEETDYVILTSAKFFLYEKIN